MNNLFSIFIRPDSLEEIEKYFDANGFEKTYLNKNLTQIEESNTNLIEKM